MKSTKNFPFEKARRITDKEVKTYRKEIEKKTGKKRKTRGRPKKSLLEKYKAVSIRLHPKVVAWAKKQGKKRGVGYQTVINEILLKRVT